MTRSFIRRFVALLPALVATPAVAYVGPGAGLSLLGALWGLLVAVLAALSFLILWPLRRRRRRARARRAEAESSNEEPAARDAVEARRAQPAEDRDQ